MLTNIVQLMLVFLCVFPGNTRRREGFRNRSQPSHGRRHLHNIQEIKMCAEDGGRMRLSNPETKPVIDWWTDANYGASVSPYRYLPSEDLHPGSLKTPRLILLVMELKKDWYSKITQGRDESSAVLVAVWVICNDTIFVGGEFVVFNVFNRKQECAALGKR